jgi:hypothetical protein
MLARATQTNEPGRCATLLPVLARLPQPLALIEVGASAGLCLLPDRYAYAYDGREVRGADAAPGAPIFPCRTEGPVPVPETPPRVAWRAGLDLDPIDVADKDSTAWLETLVWPEATERTDRLRAALAVARADPPRIVRGDLRHGLETLAAEAPKDATLVVFHTAVLTYVYDPAERAAFAASVGQVCDHWVSNEPPAAFPEIAARAHAPRPPGNFLLALDGEPLAWTDPHGATTRWLGTAGSPGRP